jgi:hypothetical protein
MRRRHLLAGGLAAACGSLRARGFAAAQSKRLPVVAYVSIGHPDGRAAPYFPAHRAALAALGWEDGRNVRLQTHVGDGQIASLRPILEGLCHGNPVPAGAAVR